VDFYPTQASLHIEAAGIPETRMFAHQMAVGRFDIDLELDSALVFTELVALHPAHLDLPVIHGAVLIQRTESLGLQGQVQTRLAVGEVGRLLEGDKVAPRFAAGRFDADIDTRYQGFQAGYSGQ